MSAAAPFTFDYVIVGAGAAGCVLANRLTENSSATVALIEAGGEGRHPWITIPAGFSKVMVGEAFNWRFATEPEGSVQGRSIAVPRGKGLGGSTLINGMIYVRGQKNDFDGWAQRGARGWSFADVLPYFRKLEDFVGDDGDRTRGRGGPMRIERVAERPPIAEAFLSAAAQAGYARNPDYNGETQDGFGYYQVAQKNGRRWSAADGYLKPARRRANLAVFTRTQAQGLEICDGRAAAVHCARGAEALRIAARREILVAAGAIQTPHLLELSGVGDPGLLAAAGVAVRLARRDVGAGYQDHFATRMNWRVSRRLTLNDQARGLPLLLAAARYAFTRRGILTLGTGLAHGFVRTRPGLDGPDAQYFFMHASYANAADRRLDREPGMTIGVTQLRPQSRGSIHLRSSDPRMPPAIRPNFLDAAIDRQTIVEAMKIARAIVAKPAMDAWRAHEMNPGPGVESDAEWLDFARANGQTIYHPVGTCRMGGDPDSVVDERLRLRGVSGLRVVDASVMPTIVSANTQAAVMMIAEKAADMIREEAR